MSKKVLGGKIKAISENRIAGYLVYFTSVKERDLYNEWFSEDTDFWLERGFKMKGKPVLIEHGFSDTFRTMSVGVFDFESVDDVGIYVEAALLRRQDYEDMLDELNGKGGIAWDKARIVKQADLIEKTVVALIDTGKTAFSSGALPQSYQVDRDTGHIKSWAIVEGSITMTPAAPEGTEVAFKETMSALSKRMETSDDATSKENSASKETQTKSDDTEPGADKTQSNGKNVEAEDNEMPTAIEILQGIATQINEKLGELLPEEDIESVVDEVTTEIEALPEAEQDTLDEDAVVERMWTLIQVKLDAKKQSDAKTQKALDKRLESWQGAQEVIDPVQPHQESSQHISVSEELKYAHLSAEAMALGVKLVMAQVPEWDRAGMTLGEITKRGILSEGYIRAMVHKMESAFKAWTPNNDPIAIADHAAYRSIRPFRADELHATDISTQGQEWVELWYDVVLWERARDRTELYNRMVSLGMEVETIPQGANGMNIKTNTSSGTVYTMPEANDVDATQRPEVVARLSQFGTGEVTKNVGTHVLAHNITYQLQEDSIINILAWLPKEMIQVLTEAREDAMINGDDDGTASTNINLIDGTPATGLESPLYMIWDGIRQQYLIANSAFALDAEATLTVDIFERIKEKFPSTIKNRVQNMLFVVNSITESRIRRLPELLTVGVAGQQATIYVGDIPPLFGPEIYMSGQLAQANSAGKISATAGNNTLGQISCLYAPYWKYGRKRKITIEQDRYARGQSTDFVATIRHAFGARGAGAAAGAYNVLNA